MLLVSSEEGRRREDGDEWGEKREDGRRDGRVGAMVDDGSADPWTTLPSAFQACALRRDVAHGLVTIDDDDVLAAPVEEVAAFCATRRFTPALTFRAAATGTGARGAQNALLSRRRQRGIVARRPSLLIQATQNRETSTPKVRQREGFFPIHCEEKNIAYQ
jgi:hypothetical protein